MQQRWAEIEIAAIGDAQEIVGALLTYQANCQGYVTTEKAVTGYLPVDDRLEETLLTLKDALQTVPAPFRREVGKDLTIRFVEEADWANAWKQYFKPQRIGKNIVIRPTWEEWDAAESDIVILIDPGMAFGTGLHATTRLCLRALEENLQPGMTVADVGTGSGILAVGAALLGALSVTATDIDPLAVRIALENIVVNAVGDRVTAAIAELPPPGIFDVVVANILADTILGMGIELTNSVKPGGLLIVSGIITERATNVQTGLTAHGLDYLKTEEEGEWVAILLRKP